MVKSARPASFSASCRANEITANAARSNRQPLRARKTLQEHCKADAVATRCLRPLRAPDSKTVRNQQDVINEPKLCEPGMKTASGLHVSQKPFRTAAFGPKRPAVGRVDPA